MSKKQTPARLALMALLMLCASLTSGAYDFSYNNVCFNITSAANRTCEVTQRPGGYSGPWVIPANPVYNGVTYTCTAIGDEAFSYCTELSRCTLPNTITRIGNYAFLHCEILPDITFPNSVTSMGPGAMQHCYKLGSVTWSTGMTTIPDWTFGYCYSLTDFQFPHWITSIGLNAFTQTNIKQAILPYGLKIIGMAAFNSCPSLATVLIPSSVTSVSSSAFGYCSSLKTMYCNMATPPALDFTDVPYDCRLYVPVGKVDQYKAKSGWSNRSYYVKAGAYDFNYGDGYSATTRYHMTVTSTTPVTYNGTAYAGTAKYVYHPNIEAATATTFGATLYETDEMCGSGKKYLITEIGDSCFHNMSSGVTTLDLSACRQLTRVGKYAFGYALGLKSIVLPDGVTSIGDWAFLHCENLSGITFPNSVTSMGSGAMQHCYKLESVTWSTGMTTIPDWTFGYCYGLTGFQFPHWITSIGLNAFTQTNIKQAILPYGLKIIGMAAFNSCPSLATVLIPSSVTSVSSSAFGYCSSLKTMYCNMATPPALDFTDVPYDCRLYVPVGKVDQYKAKSGWSNHSNYVDAGAYDYNYGDGYDPNGLYHMTITSATPVTYNGTTYAGTAKYVYHPNIEATTATTFAPWLSETDGMCGSGKDYLITEIGDSCFFNSPASITSISFEACKKLTKVGHDAFWTSQVKKLKLPASVTAYGEYALYYMPNLTDLYVMNATPATVPNNTFYSHDQQRATLHVPNRAAVNAYKAAEVWKKFYSIVSEVVGMRGDVNDDGYVDVSDVSALIDHLLNGAAVNEDNADCDVSGSVDVSDVSVLIDYLLNGSWPASLMAPAAGADQPLKPVPALDTPLDSRIIDNKAV